MEVQDVVRPNDFFKIKIKTKAPQKNKHYSAGYMLIDETGNYFGDKVVLDIIVEDDCSDAVILAEMMDNVDMSRQEEVEFTGIMPSPRNERVSMMIHRQPQNVSQSQQQ